MAADRKSVVGELRHAGVCRSGRHPEGELDARVVSFYENLRGRYPDYPPFGDDSPWMDTPLSVGVDHVSMHLSFGERGQAASELIDELARRSGLPSTIRRVMSSRGLTTHERPWVLRSRR